MKLDLFAALNEGFDALKRERESKVSLREHLVDTESAPRVVVAESKAQRE